MGLDVNMSKSLEPMSETNLVQMDHFKKCGSLKKDFVSYCATD